MTWPLLIKLSSFSALYLLRNFPSGHLHILWLMFGTVEVEYLAVLECFTNLNWKFNLKKLKISSILYDNNIKFVYFGKLFVRLLKKIYFRYLTFFYGPGSNWADVSPDTRNTKVTNPLPAFRGWVETPVSSLLGETQHSAFGLKPVFCDTIVSLRSSQPIPIEAWLSHSNNIQLYLIPKQAEFILWILVNLKLRLIRCLARLSN